MSSYIIGDIHGCAETLEALLTHIPSNAEIYTTGDLIDRGPGSRRVISTCMERGIKSVMGNHEHMLLDYLDESGIYPRGLFFQNGGRQTLKNYDSKLPQIAPEHIDYLRGMPLYIETEHFILSHAGVHFMKNMREACDIAKGLEHNILWNRAKLADLGKLQVIGHTPVREVRRARSGDKISSINIDTGCYSQDFGKLTAISIPDLELIQLPCIDDLGWHSGLYM
ncbi:MAG: metallophosphoesterase [bacterium]|nr:metallophosphoesterase [bacterium]